MGTRNNRPNELTYKPVNDIGFIVESRCRLPELKVYEEHGSVLFWASVVNDSEDREIEAMQYLTPEVAMKMSKALRACAIKALENKE